MLPDSTTWPGALSLATVTPPASAISRASSSEAPDEREHAAVAGLAHQLAAQHDELERVVAAQHAGGGERGELAERMTGGGGRMQVQGVPAGDRRAEDRGLGVAGVLTGAREGVLADELGHALEQSGARWATRSRISGVWLPCPGNERSRFCGVAHICTITDGCVASHL
jgi:hypothetical protein